MFDSYQEMSECCGCLVSPDGLLTFSLNDDLTSNPPTGVTLSTGVIKIVSNATVGGDYCPLPFTPNSRSALLLGNPQSEQHLRDYRDGFAGCHFQCR